MDELLKRIESLKKSNVYNGTIYENILSNENIELFKTLGILVTKRDCKTYPYFISWQSEIDESKRL